MGPTGEQTRFKRDLSTKCAIEGVQRGTGGVLPTAVPSCAAVTATVVVLPYCRMKEIRHNHQPQTLAIRVIAACPLEHARHWTSVISNNHLGEGSQNDKLTYQVNFPRNTVI
jgi:hypothetical protein